MNMNLDFSKLFASVKSKGLAIALGFSLLVVASPAAAHHPLGGGVPSNFFEGFLSGLAHPVIGFDHLAFIVAIGLVAALKPQGWLMPIAFVYRLCLAQVCICWA